MPALPRPFDSRTDAHRPSHLSATRWATIEAHARSPPRAARVPRTLHADRRQMALREEKRRCRGAVQSAARGRVTAWVRTKDCGKGEILVLRSKTAKTRAERFGVRRGIAALFGHSRADFGFTTLARTPATPHPCKTDGDRTIRSYNVFDAITPLCFVKKRSFTPPSPARA